MPYLRYTCGRNTHSFGLGFKLGFRPVQIKKTTGRNPKPLPKPKPWPKHLKPAETIRNCPKLAETVRNCVLDFRPYIFITCHFAE